MLSFNEIRKEFPGSKGSIPTENLTIGYYKNTLGVRRISFELEFS